MAANITTRKRIDIICLLLEEKYSIFHFAEGISSAWVWSNLEFAGRTEDKENIHLLYEFASVDIDTEVRYIPGPSTDKL